jgi:hypothetical protein
MQEEKHHSCKEMQYHHIFSNEFNFSFNQPDSDTGNLGDIFKMALKSAKAESDLKDMQRAKMEESAGTPASDFPSVLRIPHLTSSHRKKSDSN